MKIEIPAPNGYKIVAERNPDRQYDKELYVYVVDDKGNIAQDLAVIRPTYHYDADWNLTWLDDFNVYVYGDPDIDTNTHEFIIKRRKEEY